MLFINCKVELKLGWTKYSVLPAAGNDNLNNSDNSSIIFIIKNTKLYFLVVTLPARDNQKVTKRFSKGFKLFIRLNIKQKVIIKIPQINLDVLMNHSFFFGVNRLFDLVHINHETKMLKVLMLKGIISEKE